MEEDEEDRQKTEAGEEEKPRTAAYPCQEPGPVTQHTDPTAAGDSERLGGLLHRAWLGPSIPAAAPESRGGGGGSRPAQQF